MIPEGFVLRRLHPADSLDELTALLHRAYAPLAEQGMRFVASWQDPEITRKRIDRGQCFVGALDGQIAATVTVTDPSAAYGSPWYERPDVACLNQLAVEPSLQRCGIGRLLVAESEAAALAAGAGHLALDTSVHATELIKWYERLGYERIEEVDWSATNYVSVVMSKAVSP